MKSYRSLIYLIIATIVAMVVFVIEKPDESRVSDVTGKYFVDGYDSGTVDKVLVEQLLDGATLTRNGDGWEVSALVTPLRQQILDQEKGSAAPLARKFAADRSRVNGAIGVFSGLEEGVLVSDNPDKQNIYQVGPAGLHVKGLDSKGNAVFDVVIGKNGPDFISSYIRRGDRNEVYLVNRPLVGVFSPRYEDWRTRLIWSIDPAVLGEISAKSGDRQAIFVKDQEGNWNSAAVDEFLKTGSALSASDFADDIDIAKVSLDKPQTAISLSLSDGKKLTLLIGNQDDSKRYYAMLEGGTDVYLIDSDVVERIEAMLR